MMTCGCLENRLPTPAGIYAPMVFSWAEVSLFSNPHMTGFIRLDCSKETYLTTPFMLKVPVLKTRNKVEQDYKCMI